MAVIAVWQCDRDGAMFQNKKDADEHDKMLELAEGISQLIGQNIEGLSEDAIEAIGLLLARKREALVKACKGRTEALFESEDADVESPKQVIAPEDSRQTDLYADAEDSTNVLPLKAKA